MRALRATAARSPPSPPRPQPCLPPVTALGYRAAAAACIRLPYTATAAAGPVHYNLTPSRLYRVSLFTRSEQHSSRDPAACLAAVIKASTLMPERAFAAAQSGSNGLASLLRPFTSSLSSYTSSVAAAASNTTATPLPRGDLADVCAKLNARVYDFLDAEPADEYVRSAQARTRVSLSIIEEALEKYSLEELSLSYNGGKDCLVILILYLCALHSYAVRRATAQGIEYATATSVLPKLLPSVYIISPHPFEEIDEFVDSSSEDYRLSLARYDMPMKEAFDAYLKAHPTVKGIFVGTRRTDPHGATLDSFTPTDSNWPSFMRIHPVLDWQYADVWTFIRSLDVPYCCLYDQGYTSLGGTKDTNPNPVLKHNTERDEKAEVTFRPAYELLSDDAERLGRD